jgi:hypothetical protein
MMRPSGVLTRFIVSPDYQVPDKHTTEKEFLSESIGSADRLPVGHGSPRPFLSLWGETDAPAPVRATGVGKGGEEESEG